MGNPHFTKTKANRTKKGGGCGVTENPNGERPSPPSPRRKRTILHPPNIMLSFSIRGIRETLSIPASGAPDQANGCACWMNTEVLCHLELIVMLPRTSQHIICAGAAHQAWVSVKLFHALSGGPTCQIMCPQDRHRPSE